MTTAFVGHGRAAAKHLGLEKLPLVIAPHPVNDLSRDDLVELARAALPSIVDHLTGRVLEAVQQPVNFVHPKKRNDWGIGAPLAGGGS